MSTGHIMASASRNIPVHGTAKFRLGRSCPTQHRIKADVVMTLIADMLRVIAKYCQNDRGDFVRTVQEAQAEQQMADITRKKKRLAAAQKRTGELEKLTCKIYEDNALGKLPDTRYAALDAQYAKEQDILSGEIAAAAKGYRRLRAEPEISGEVHLSR